ncbi:MAG: hypothetical protein DRQ55_11480 [Planctomycetota bacterium]|nr:MAG: hypothetical protein DRQ55_11480 [Planctomycetota bacterium]
MRSALVLLLALALLPACSSNDYLNNRGGDVVDILRGKVMFGPGIGAKGEFTRVLHGGILYSHKSFAAGIGNRELGVWRESVFTWGLLIGYHDERYTSPIPYLSGSYGWVFGSGEDGGVLESSGYGGALDLLTVRGTLQLVVGIDIEFRFGELLDFFAGLAAFDPVGDDVFTERLEPEPAAESVETEDTLD